MRRLMLGAAATLAAGAMLVSTAQAFEPRKPIQFVIMAGKGGGADKMARLMQAVVEQEGFASRPLVPINKSGGSGAEALITVKNARDKNHTIMVTLNSFFTTPLRQPGIRVDIMDFTPVGRMAEDTFLLWVHKDSGITSFEQFLEEAGAAGNGWVMGGTGKAAEDNILTNYLNNNFNLDIKYIPYKGGGAVAKDLAGQQINSSVNNPSEALGFYEAGIVVPLVAFTDERLPMFPDVPTMKEKGADFAYYMQRAVVGAPGMSDDAAAYYSDMFKKVFDSAQWQKYRSDKSLGGDWMTGDDLKAYWDAQRTRHEGLLRDMGAIK